MNEKFQWHVHPDVELLLKKNFIFKCLLTKMFLSWKISLKSTWKFLKAIEHQIKRCISEGKTEELNGQQWKRINLYDYFHHLLFLLTFFKLNRKCCFRSCDINFIKNLKSYLFKDILIALRFNNSDSKNYSFNRVMAEEDLMKLVLKNYLYLKACFLILFLDVDIFLICMYIEINYSWEQMSCNEIYIYQWKILQISMLSNCSYIACHRRILLKEVCAFEFT